MLYILAWNTVLWSPRLKLCLFLKPLLCTPVPVPLIVFDPSVYQTRPSYIWFKPDLALTLVRELDC